MYIRLRKGMTRNLMKFNKVKGKVLHLWKNKPKHQCRLEDDHEEGIFAEEDLRPCREHTFIAKKAHGILGCIRQGTASHSRKVILSHLLSNAGATPGVLGPVLGSLIQERHGHTVTMMMKGLEHLSYTERLRELGLVRLDKNRLRGKRVHKYLQGRCNRTQTGFIQWCLLTRAEAMSTS